MRSFFPLLAGVLCYALGVTAEASKADKLKERLEPLLSPDAVLNFPSSDAWDRLTERYSAPRIAPDYLAIVEVATEEDVQNAIKTANGLNIPFLAVSGAHGFTTQLNKLKQGLAINMRKLNKPTLNPSSGTVTVGGGTLGHELLSFLDTEGKQAAVGLCQCISVVGPVLGGAHTMLQSERGFGADNLVSARVVLADGSVVVASEDENADLLWGLRGAGHNFGVVTSAELRTFDTPEESWTMVTMWFTGDKLEAYFEAWNRMEEEHDDPGMLVINGHVLMNPEIDPENPVLDLFILYQGNSTAAADYVAAFRALEPAIDTTATDIPWGSLHDAGGFGLDAPVCQGGMNLLTYPNSVASWDPAAMRAGYDLIAEAVSDPRLVNAFWILESYGRKGPQSFPPGYSAVAPEERDYHILMSMSFSWVGEGDGEVAEAAKKYADAIREVSRSDVTPAHTYVNYSPGDASLAEIYGRDQNRLKKLKALKKQWDPKNKFGFYNPIR